MAPVPPKVTASCNPQDVFEHAPMKGLLEQVKADAHYAARLEQKTKFKVAWDTPEMEYVVEETLRRHVERYPDMPLQSMIQCQLLAMRPSGENEVAACIDHCTLYGRVDQ